MSLRLRFSIPLYFTFNRSPIKTAFLKLLAEGFAALRGLLAVLGGQLVSNGVERKRSADDIALRQAEGSHSDRVSERNL